MDPSRRHSQEPGTDTFGLVRRMCYPHYGLQRPVRAFDLVYDVFLYRLRGACVQRRRWFCEKQEQLDREEHRVNTN